MHNKNNSNLILKSVFVDKNLSLFILILPIFVLLLTLSLFINSQIFTLLPIYIIAIMFLILIPEFLITAIIVFTSTLFPLDVFPQPISFGKIGLYLPEALVVVLLVRTILTTLVKKDFRKLSSELTLPMILLFVWIVFAVANAVLSSQRADFLVAILNVRCYIFYANFFLINYYIDTADKFNIFVKGLIIIAGVCSIFSIIQFVVGPETKILPWFTWVVGSINYQSKESVARVFPKSLAIIYTIFFPIFVCWINGVLKRKWLYFFFMLLCLSAIFVSFTRAIHYSTLFGFLIIWFITRGKLRFRLISNLITVLLFVFLIVIFLPIQLGFIRITNWWGVMFERHSEFITAGAATETLAWRAIETNAIINAIKRSPIIGNGIGASYYHPLYRDDVTLAHNGYLSILFQIGLVGLTIMLVIFYKFICVCVKTYKRTDNKYYKNLILGFMIAFISILPSVISEPVFVKDYWWISLLGVIWGVPTVISRILNRKSGSIS